MISLIQIILGIIVIILILLQQKGTEGGSLFGVQSYFFSERRGIEKYIYYLTWFFIASFIIVSILKILIK